MAISKILSGVEIDPESWINKFVFVSQPGILTSYSSANRVLGYAKKKLHIEFLAWRKNEKGIFEQIAQKNVETLDIKISNVKIVADTEMDAIRVMKFMDSHEQEYYNELRRLNASIADIENILNYTS